MLFIEYDVTREGEIELVALVNAVEAEGSDPDGEDWMAWRRSTFDDRGMGCAAVPADDLTLLESTRDAEQVRAIVERIVLADRRAKEQAAP